MGTTFDPRKRAIMDTNLILADGATGPGAIASAGSTSVTATNVVDLKTTTFLPNQVPRLNIIFPAGLGTLKSGSTLAIRVNDCATSGGTYVLAYEKRLNDAAIASGTSYSIGLAQTRRYLQLTLYLSNTASTDDLSGYTYTAWIDAPVRG